MSTAIVSKGAGSPSACFVAHNAFGTLAGHNLQHVGGIERQQVTMAVWLASRGWQVSMVTWNDRDTEPEVIDGVNVITMCKRDAGLPGLRFLHPRWTSLNSALTTVAADIYYYNCGDLALGQLALWAKRHDRPVVFSIASDPDCDPDLPALHSLREKTLYRYGLKNSRHIIVQSEKQKDMLQNGFSLPSTVLPMPSRGFAEQGNRRDRLVRGSRFHVLWVGRLSSEKRPDWIIEIARKLPQIDFTLVGAPNRESDYASAVQEQGSALPNVTLAGRVPFERMADFYPEADLLCCTSVYEGFPNVFLEAWSVGVPVVTTCDPDGIVEQHALGKHAGSIDEIVNAISELSEEFETWNNMSEAAARYFKEQHELHRAMAAFEEYFLNVRNAHYGGAT